MSKNNTPPKTSQCGLVMPISSIDGYSEQHWTDVKFIITEALESVDFKVTLVSEADDVGIIHRRIIQNLYENPIVVCDVSGKNPNVMFELGLRLAFDKPTIIIKDEKTSYSFDTSPIEHLEYPSDLRFNKIVEFKKQLAQKAQKTLAKSQSDKNYSAFLHHFGAFEISKLDTKTLSKEDFIIEEIQLLRREIARNSSQRYPAKKAISLNELREKEIQSALFDVMIEKDLPLANQEWEDVKEFILEELTRRVPVKTYFSSKLDFESSVKRAFQLYS